MADANIARRILLQPRDPIIVRDARPFSADPGSQAVTLDWPPPTTIAGALRTHIGNAANFDWDGSGPTDAHKIHVRGPLLLAMDVGAREWTTYLPAPLDAVPYNQDGDEGMLCLRPVRLPSDLPAADARGTMPEGAGWDLPDKKLRPVAVEGDVKQEGGFDFWSLADTLRWLGTPSSTKRPTDYLGALPRDTRTHVSIDREKQTNVEGALFSTQGLVFRDVPKERDPETQRRFPATAMLCRVETETALPIPEQALLPLGGERRLVFARALADGEAKPVWPVMPDSLRNTLKQTSRLRLQLVTPAIFTGGWRPGWLSADTLEGTPPNLKNGLKEGLKLRLVSAVVGRRIPVSGWSLHARAARDGRPALNAGPRKTQYAAPAGSVYFFEIVNGPLTEEQIKRLWLQPVSDDEQKRRDGFGLVVPGIW